jgi:hypothetical protein
MFFSSYNSSINLDLFPTPNREEFKLMLEELAWMDPKVG